MGFGRELMVIAVAAALLGCSEDDTENETSALVEPSAVATPDTRYTLGDGGVSAFYHYEGEIPEGPGTLLRQEPLEAHQSVPSAAENIRLLYTSTDGLDGETPIVVSGALFLPAGTPPEGGWPLLLWSHGTVGIADICAPTWTGYVPFHQEHLKRWIEEGYAIVASDYQGLGTMGTHPYLATRPAAYNNLDVIRAVQAADFPLTDKVVIAGQSQGAGAVIATAGHAPTYAPDIDLRGVVATGVPFFSPEGLVAVREMRPQDVVDPMLGYNFLALTLIQQINPDFNIGDYVSDAALPMAQGVANICNRDMRAKIEEAGLTYNMTFKQSPSEHLIEAFRKMQFPSLKLPVPLFVGSGAIDRDTPLRMQAGFVKQACAAGSTVEAHRYGEHDHLTTLNHSTIDSTKFVAAVFADTEIAGNCESLPFDD